MNQVFGFHHDAMNIFWLEAGCVKKYGKSLRFQYNVIDSIRNEVFERFSFKVTKSIIVNMQKINFIKLETTIETPASI